MPHDPKLYPDNWKEVSFRVQVRAGFRCEWTDPRTTERCKAVSGNAHPNSGSLVVLAAAHTCTCHPKCGEDDHLLCVCQEHHFLIDSKQHANAAAETRRQQLRDAGQATLFDL